MEEICEESSKTGSRRRRELGGGAGVVILSQLTVDEGEEEGRGMGGKKRQGAKLGGELSL